MAAVAEAQSTGARQTLGIYARLGIRTFINASGHNTAQGGSLMAPEVLRAMEEASGNYVSLRALQEAAGQRIAEVVGAPAALVSSGAAGAILLGAAAALAGSDPVRIQALPETPKDGRHGIVVWYAPRPNYMYQACQAAGGRLVEVGQPGDALSPEPLQAALDDHTAAILLVLAPIDQALGRGAGNALRWPDFVGAVAGAANDVGVPVLVDAASELPPRGLIRQLLDLGVAGVIVSGGKAIRGPQSSGILAGRPDLIAAAHLNNNPLQAIGRPMKVGKEEICGLVTAVERFFAMDETAQLASWDGAARQIVGAVPAGGAVRATVMAGDPNVGRPPIVPKAVLTFDGGAPAADALARTLFEGQPAIQTLRQGDYLIFNPMTLETGEADIVASRLRAVLST